MGTRGHFFIRCRGRYFVYYNQFDSYPEGLGDAIVNSIPIDPEEFRSEFHGQTQIDVLENSPTKFPLQDGWNP